MAKEKGQKDIAGNEVDKLYPVWTYESLKSYTIDPSHYIVGEGFLRRGAAMLSIGPTTMGKSVLVEQLAVCVAGGMDFFDMKVKRPCRVLILQAENDEDTMKRDILSIVRHLKVDEKRIQKNLTIRHMFGLTDEAFGRFFEEDVVRHKPRLVIVDHLQSYTDGDLNRSDVFKKWVTPVDEVLKAYGIALVLVCHTGKPRRDTDDWTREERVYMATGHSGQSNWARTSMELVQLRKDPGRFKLIFGKCPARTGLKDQEGRIIDTIYIEHSHDPTHPYWSLCASQNPDMKIDWIGLVQKCANENPKWSYREISDHLHCNKNTVEKYYPSSLRRKRVMAHPQ